MTDDERMQRESNLIAIIRIELLKFVSGAPGCELNSASGDPSFSLQP